MSDIAVIERLWQVIETRREQLELIDSEVSLSYTAQLLRKGPAKCAEKFGEEAVEAIIEAARGDSEKLAAEGADVIYHLLVMLSASKTPLSEVLAVLANREGVSGVLEKQSRHRSISLK